MKKLILMLLLLPMVTVAQRQILLECNRTVREIEGIKAREGKTSVVFALGATQFVMDDRGDVKGYYYGDVKPNFQFSDFDRSIYYFNALVTENEYTLPMDIYYHARAGLLVLKIESNKFTFSECKVVIVNR